ncbi:hypothetical protein [Paludisphaera soli]|uniref:hypothetical protein n=1 Tax=Paludisphaera soli TaxID=2712865 RepID=UPI0013EBB681|nr:hypothetical protein [Paludisphaera soli]
MGRLPIARLMVLIGIAALELVAIRALVREASRLVLAGPLLASRTFTILIYGALPMANVLAFGLAIGWRRRSPFLLGFATFGAAALALALAGLARSPDETVGFLCDRVIEPLFKAVTHGRYVTKGGLIVLHAVVVAGLILPQLALALIGGLLFHGASRVIVGPPR